MQEEELRQLIEQIDPEGKLPPENIEALITAIKENEKNPPKDGDVRNGLHFHTLGDLKVQMETEKDWRKRASLAAKIISLGLE